MPSLTLVLGGAASGKSVWAEKFLISKCLAPVYLATARVFDDEIKFKINLHKARRGPEWTEVEADTELGPVLQAVNGEQAVLIDCATMWLSNVMLDEADLDSAQSSLFHALRKCRGPVVMVSNEVGHGIVPDNALARRFREAQGRLNCAIAEQADLVVFVTAGLPQVLKGQMP